jgi:hypothetical protein
LESVGGVISPEDFGSESFHLRFEIVVECLRIDLVEEVVVCLFAAAEEFDVIPDSGDNLDCVDVLHGIFSTEIKFDFLILNGLIDTGRF